MKIREGFVSNSSSSSFLLRRAQVPQELIHIVEDMYGTPAIRKHLNCDVCISGEFVYVYQREGGGADLGSFIRSFAPTVESWYEQNGEGHDGSDKPLHMLKRSKSYETAQWLCSE